MTDDRISDENPNVIAARVTAKKIEAYGSIDNWPVLELLPVQFPICSCGELRVHHAFMSTDRLGAVKSDSKCKVFSAARASRA